MRERKEICGEVRRNESSYQCNNSKHLIIIELLPFLLLRPLLFYHYLCVIFINKLTYIYIYIHAYFYLCYNYLSVCLLKCKRWHIYVQYMFLVNFYVCDLCIRTRTQCICLITVVRWAYLLNPTYSFTCYFIYLFVAKIFTAVL